MNPNNTKLSANGTKSTKLSANAVPYVPLNHHCQQPQQLLRQPPYHLPTNTYRVPYCPPQYHQLPPLGFRPDWNSYGPPTPGLPIPTRAPPISSTPSNTRDLREKIVKQIEYYFSDENLTNNHHLTSLMDGEGWVPISSISEFRRLKIMCRDIAVILGSLIHGSKSVEVKGHMVRRRGEWERWIQKPAPVPPVASNPQADQQTRPNLALGMHVDIDASHKNINEVSSGEENLTNNILSKAEEHGIGSIQV